MNFLDLPIDVVDNILSYLTYDEISKTREVCSKLNSICMSTLNRGFLIVEQQHAVALKCIKSQLPRRESERRSHPLALHNDILSCIETRISMLSMTYSRYIEGGYCCFIPGKIIDEIKRLLLILAKPETPPKAHEVLQELRDISSMAIEHFDEKISPEFRKCMNTSIIAPIPSPDLGMFPQMFLNKEVGCMRRRNLLSSKLSLHLVSQCHSLYKQMLESRRLAWKQEGIIRMLRKKQKKQDSTIAELKRRVDECDIKYRELTHTNQNAGVKAIAASTSGIKPVPSQSLRHFSSQIKLDLSMMPIGVSKRNHGKISVSNIKPRASLIKLPSSIEREEPLPKIPKLGVEACSLSSLHQRFESTLASIKVLTENIMNREKASTSKRNSESSPDEVVAKKQKY